jgi:hypothetical protein
VTGDLRTDQVLSEFSAVPRHETDPALDAVALAILVEDALGVVLTDDDIDAAILTDPQALSALLSRRPRGGP